jgi:hypothetical protein
MKGHILIFATNFFLILIYPLLNNQEKKNNEANQVINK